MIEQIGNALKFTAFFVATKQGKTGLTVTVDVYNPAGTLIVTAAAASEIGGGAYMYVLASGSVTTEGEYLAIFKTADGTVDQQHLPVIWSVGRAGVEHLNSPIAGIPALAWDEILTGATHNILNSAGRRLRQITDGGLYEGGYVHIDTINGVAGTTAFINGTVLSPSNNIADATTLAVALGLRGFKIRNGSSITLAQNYSRYDFVGESWTLALGGRDITGCYLRGAAITGVGLGSGISLENGNVVDATIPPGEFQLVGLRGTITLSAGEYYFDGCFNGAIGATEAILEYGAAIGATNVRMHHYAGALTVQNLKAGDEFSMNGSGRVTLAASCTAGLVQISGTIRLIDQSTGITLNDTSRFSESELITQMVDQLLDDPVPSTHPSGSAGAALGKIGSAQVTVSVPVAYDGSLQLVQGDDYADADGRALEWTDTANKWPVLTGASVKLSIGPSLSVPGTVVVATGTNKKVRAELTAAQTATLLPGVYAYDVQLTLATTNRIITAVVGTCTVLEDIST